MQNIQNIPTRKQDLKNSRKQSSEQRIQRKYVPATVTGESSSLDLTWSLLVETNPSCTL